MVKRKINDTNGDPADFVDSYWRSKRFRNYVPITLSITKSAKPTTSTSQAVNKMPKVKAQEPSDSESSDSESEHPENSETDEKTTCNKVTISEQIGDLIDAFENSILAHACNCIGRWGAGIAAYLRKHYPIAYQIYHKHCMKYRSNPGALLGTCLLIPPQKNERHWIACLFTSHGFGKRTDKEDLILKNTQAAMEDLLHQIKEFEVNEKADDEDEDREPENEDENSSEDDDNDKRKELQKPGELWMCKINSGLFGVPWERTKEIIESLTFEGGLTITVIEKR